MLTTIHFDNQQILQAHKIGDVVTNCYLSAKFVSDKTSIPQMSPQQSFRIGLLFA